MPPSVSSQVLSPRLFDRADAIDRHARLRHETAPRLEMQMREVESARLTALNDRLSDSSHITLNGRVRQFVLVICHAPSAAGTEMPFAIESDLFGEIERHVNGRD
jgi:hypothetical protein